MNEYPGSALHQIGPYIGKIRPDLARRLIIQYSKQGDWIWDPFCGSGTIPLEGRLLGRHVIAADINPYACVLTRAKLHAPSSENYCISQLALCAEALKSGPQVNQDGIPKWVKDFFHAETLREITYLAELFAKKKQYFILGCLLGILHHQRPGFLSYPSSHLVPYLRSRLYPSELYPEAYHYRDPIPRLRAKVKRVLKYPPLIGHSRFKVLQKSAMKRYLPGESVNTVITSPPYMDVLDYARDNRLRLWFLGIDNYKAVKRKEVGKINTFKEGMLQTLQIMSQVIKPGGSCVLILGDVTRGNKNYDVPAMVCYLVNEEIKEFCFERQWVDRIPAYRRARRNGRATQKETILVFRRNGRG